MYVETGIAWAWGRLQIYEKNFSSAQKAPFSCPACFLHVWKKTQWTMGHERMSSRNNRLLQHPKAHRPIVIIQIKFLGIDRENRYTVAYMHTQSDIFKDVTADSHDPVISQVSVSNPHPFQGWLRDLTFNLTERLFQPGRYLWSAMKAALVVACYTLTLSNSQVLVSTQYTWGEEQSRWLHCTQKGKSANKKIHVGNTLVLEEQ